MAQEAVFVSSFISCIIQDYISYNFKLLSQKHAKTCITFVLPLLNFFSVPPDDALAQAAFIWLYNIVQCCMCIYCILQKLYIHSTEELVWSMWMCVSFHAALKLRYFPKSVNSRCKGQLNCDMHLFLYIFFCGMFAVAQVLTNEEEFLRSLVSCGCAKKQKGQKHLCKRQEITRNPWAVFESFTSLLFSWIRINKGYDEVVHES